MATPKGTKPWNAGTAKPYMNNRGYLCRKVEGREVKEHRFIMEAHLGRKLEPWEHVHHKDGNKTNNAVENLAVISAEEHNREHAGSQRSDSAKRTMAIYREMRMEIDRLRSTNSEMLEALKWAFARLDRLAPHNAFEGDGELYQFVKAKAVIQKAEGV